MNFGSHTYFFNLNFGYVITRCIRFRMYFFIFLFLLDKIFGFTPMIGIASRKPSLI